MIIAIAKRLVSPPIAIIPKTDKIHTKTMTETICRKGFWERLIDKITRRRKSKFQRETGCWP